MKMRSIIIILPAHSAGRFRAFVITLVIFFSLFFSVSLVFEIMLHRRECQLSRSFQGVNTHDTYTQRPLERFIWSGSRRQPSTPYLRCASRSRFLGECCPAQPVSWSVRTTSQRHGPRPILSSVAASGETLSSTSRRRPTSFVGPCQFLTRSGPDAPEPCWRRSWAHGGTWQQRAWGALLGLRWRARSWADVELGPVA